MMSSCGSPAAGGSGGSSGCASGELAAMDTACSGGGGGAGGTRSSCSADAGGESASDPSAAGCGAPSTSPSSNPRSSELGSSPEEAALQGRELRQPRMQPLPAAAPLRRTLIICASNRLFECDAAAVKAAAAAPEVHAGGGLDEWMTRHNLNAAGRAHSIMRPVALPATAT